MVELFSTLLGLRGQANYLNLSRYMDYDERTLRQHARQSFPFEDLNTNLTAASLSGRLILAGDATFVHKSGKRHMAWIPSGTAVPAALSGAWKSRFWH